MSDPSTSPARPGEGTRAVHAGLPEPSPDAPPMPGPVLTAHYHLPGDPADAAYTYGRDGNPTWTALETAVAALESPDEPAEATVFASGMAAISAVLLSHVRPGGTVVLPNDGYNLLNPLSERLTELGATVRAVPTGTARQREAIEGADLVWLETPANPGLDVCDIRVLADTAHREGALVAVDNTLATPLGQRPLELGADFSVASGTKALSGHGDVLLGYVVCRDAALTESVRRWRKLVGAIPGPMEAWLAHRSLATLHLRTERQQRNALVLAEELRGWPEVRDVRYPGLPDDPAHELAARQMRGFGCVLSFTLPDRAFAERLLAATRVVEEATSFGGVRSTAERRGRWGGDDVPEGFVRMSVGVEDAADLVADLRQARAAAAAAARAG
ncbi:cystathionine gamma-lyase [Streptomyces alkaliterrae]|uniref:Cystathionine gamma-lyase n=1 Tax=Streptomyces alkaliterrae TaxID=2213162 RepID=A0A5P0Z0B6_9ACTN|nr:cystathionine gamma-lyase [Streptomyces alkaliterrae]MBB1252454.1 cystathionine gamma-lyase [Streptomyces alkaliterrae]MBB1261770.1 cystathionine gamma-lyase [Streptomyces alkaliterrae]MQS05009.1 cystathionine gamma-lyase [Streptomyces alkaliterrae]